MSKLNVKIFPALHKKSAKNAHTPLYVRFTFNRQKAEYRLHPNLNSEQLAKWNEFSMRVDEKNSEINRYLSELESKINRLVTQHATDLEKMTPARFRDEVFNIGMNDKVLLRDFVLGYIQKEIKNATRITQGTKKNYNKAINHFENYLVFTKQTKILIGETDERFARGFTNYLLTPSEGKKTGMSEPTALGIIKKFRTIIESAVENKLRPDNPFKKIKLSNRSPRKPKLNIAQLKKLYELDLQNAGTLELYRDIFVFCAFTGLAYTDCMNLTTQFLTQYPDGNYKLRYERQKTQEEIEQFLVKHALVIIEKYKDLPEMKLWIFHTN